MGMIIQLSLVTFPKVLTQVNNKNLYIHNAATQSFASSFVSSLSFLAKFILDSLNIQEAIWLCTRANFQLGAAISGAAP